MKSLGKLCVALLALGLAIPFFALAAIVACVAVGAGSFLVLCVLMLGWVETWFQPKPVVLHTSENVVPWKAKP